MTSSRLPIPGEDKGTWGQVLNDFLLVSHASDGSLNPASVENDHIVDGTIVASKFAPAVQTTLAKADSALQSVTRNDVGLGNVDNTSDASKPISTATQTALNAKASKVYFAAADYGWGTAKTAAQNDAALTAVIAAAFAAGGGQIDLGIGTYQVSAPIDCRATSSYGSGVELIGHGRGNGVKGTIIVNVTDSSALLLVGGFNNYFHDFTIRHSTDAPTATTGNGLVFYKSAYSTFKRLQITNTGQAVSIYQGNVVEPGTTAAAVGNYMFSNTFEDINILRYAKNGLFLNGYGGGSTGSTWTNTYIQNSGISGGQLPSTGNAVDLFLCDAVFNQLNVEDLTGSAALLVNAQSTVVINGFHLERVHLAAPGNYIRIYGGASVRISGLGFYYCNIAISGTGTVTHLSIAAGAQLIVDSIYLNNNTQTVTSGVSYTLGEVTDTDANNALEIAYYKTNATAAFTSLSGSTANTGLKRIGSTLYGLVPTVGVAAPGKMASIFFSGSDTSLATYVAAPILFNTLDQNDDATYFTPNIVTTGTYASTIMLKKTGLYLIRGHARFTVTPASKSINMLLTANGGTITEDATFTLPTANAGANAEVTKVYRATAANVSVGMAVYVEASVSYTGLAASQSRLEVIYLGN